MYQGAITEEQLPVADDWTKLRQLQWSDLVSQISARQDLRAEMTNKADASRLHGRFASLNAGDPPDGYQPVNHAHSNGGKPVALERDSLNDAPAEGDRD